jgi:hypothetical protein
VRTTNLYAKDFLIASKPTAFFTEPHHDGLLKRAKHT